MNLDLIKKLRDETGYSIIACKKALDETGGGMKKAREYLKKYIEEGAIEKKSDREAKNGIIASYVHGNRRIGVLLELNCETDFVANTKEFQELALELALQIASMDPKNVRALLAQTYIRDPSKKIKDIVAATIRRVGERIALKRFCRYVL